MKNLLIFVFSVLTFSCFGQSFEIYNQSGYSFEFKAWKDSKLIHNHIMNNKDGIKIEDIGDGVLFQWKCIDCDQEPNIQILSKFDFYFYSNGLIELLVNHSWLRKHSKWGILQMSGFIIGSEDKKIIKKESRV